MLSDVVGLVTIVVSAVGATLAFAHATFYRRSEKEVARKLVRVFATDGFIFSITLAFGIWAFLGLSFDQAIVLHWIRVPLLAMNIVASWSLYRHYRMV